MSDRAEVERLARIICKARGDNPDDIVAIGVLPRNQSGNFVLSGQSVQPAWCSCYHEAVAIFLAHQKLEDYSNV